ncbi:SDR family NAD(P)-dependent oxidoreductase [Roseobacter sp.]|uniref:SDR family NAD(P)-dependent oxidoreductase n=1 Tax=Roseobacter sp. TaxID=1907202 RepID=UPI0038590421
MKLDLKGHRALVTGAGQGIGRAIAQTLQESGAAVSGIDIDAAALTALDGTGLSTAQIDVTDADALANYAQTAGGFDIAVHVAGGVRGQVGRPVEDISPLDWDAIVSVNQTAAFYLARAVAPEMKKTGWGRIVTISSRAGLDVSLTGIQAYASAKAGQIGLARQLGHELGQYGITVNSVAPGFVRSNPTTERQWDALGPEGQDKLVSGIAMRRLGKPEDIAAAVMFLVSPQASWITGQVLSVDGGR